MLQLLEDSIQNTVLGPTVHARVNGVPITESSRKTAPFAALLSYIQDRVKYLKVGKTDVAALYRQAILNALVLLRRNLHYLQL